MVYELSCSERGERRYELEKVRYYLYDEKVTLVASGTDLDILIKQAEKISIRAGETFEDKVRIAEIVDDEVINYPYIRTVVG